MSFSVHKILHWLRADESHVLLSLGDRSHLIQTYFVIHARSAHADYLPAQNRRAAKREVILTPDQSCCWSLSDRLVQLLVSSGRSSEKVCEFVAWPNTLRCSKFVE